MLRHLGVFIFVISITKNNQPNQQNFLKTIRIVGFLYFHLIFALSTKA